MATERRTHYGNVSVPRGCHYCHTGYSHCELWGTQDAVNTMLARLGRLQTIRVTPVTYHPNATAECHVDVRGKLRDL